jgi:(2Fe-2S) ferredoxin
MPKRTSIPSWDEINRGSRSSANKLASTYLNSPTTAEDWLNTLLEETAPEEDNDFQTTDEGGPSITVTSSSNSARPRTVRAGYDFKEGTLVVVFRDGTWWEYRGVPEDMWYSFVSAQSKGKFLKESGLDAWPDMGPADISAMPRHRLVQMAHTKNFVNYMYPSKKEN